MKITLIGSYPPPFGGVSVHLKRFINYAESKGINWKLYSTNSQIKTIDNITDISKFPKLWFIWFCFFNTSSIVHMHSSNVISRIFFGFSSMLHGGAYIMTIHGRSLEESYLKSITPFRWLIKSTIRKLDYIIATNKDIERFCIEEIGVNRDKISTIPAFLPPSEDSCLPLPNNIRGFLNKHFPILFAVGWVGQKYLGSDIYGFDLLLELINKLKMDYPKIGLIIVLNGGNKTDVKQLIETVDLKYGENIFIESKALPSIAGLLKNSDLFLRPTNTDGDSVAIREALYLKTPVVASNAVPRPRECVLFNNRDIKDFIAKVKQSLQGLENLKSNISNMQNVNNGEEILNIYKKFVI